VLVKILDHEVQYFPFQCCSFPLFHLSLYLPSYLAPF
jgi:hypothetical protein